MTTAPDLPLPLELAPVALRPALTVVPGLPIDEPLPIGEPLEFEEAVRRAVPRLKRYAVRRLLDDHEAEEVVQEAMLRAFQHKDELATEDDLMAWLTVVTGRLVIDRLRVRGRSTPVAELPAESRATRDTADVVVARDEARLALDALEAMPTRQAAVLWAREVEGLSYEDICERFTMTEPSVRSVLHRARKTLRREYALRGGTLPGIGLVALAPWLEGLRWAAKMRHVARRTAGAAAITATGLAVVSVVPFGAHTTRLHASPPLMPALSLKTANVVNPTNTASKSSAAATPTAANVPGTNSTRDWQTLPHTRVICGGHVAGQPISAGCQTHHKPTVYVQLPVPVAGNRQIGITLGTNNSNSKRVCEAMPTTPVSECDKSTSPSKGTAS